jgi:hypothetical protein
MNRLSVQIGFWSALLCALAFVAFAVCFVAVFATSPLFFWTDLADYVAYIQENGQFWANLARLCMLIFAPAFIILLATIHDYTDDGKKVLIRISQSFGILFAAMIGIHYFVQLTAVRLSIQQGQLTGMEQIVQANPLSAVSAINILQINVLLFLTINFGMGGAVTLATISLAILFRSMQKELGQTARVA